MRQVLANILVGLFTTTSLLAAQPPNTPGTASVKYTLARPEKGTGNNNSAKTKSVALRHKRSSKPFQVGKASWYGKSFHGKTTASGEPYDMFQFTAAHRQLPLGTLVKVTNLQNGRSVVVRVNDRGPVPRSRIIDLSYGAARMLGIPGKGIEPVRLDIVQPTTIAANRQSQNLAGMP
ncbi:MAG TPA: septal ring lytic transglycosylase RlpA family protein [Terriglobales bacterium]|nr:septal ring lytic transglycosylase RlpA family protein [Terriglobales bacterium]